MAVFQIYTNTLNARGTGFGFCFEHPAADLGELHEAFQRDSCVMVDRLWTVDDGRQGRMIQRRQPMIIGVLYLGTIVNADRRHWEPAEEGAGQP